MKERWVNADEGAHLSDIQLIDEGMTPSVDYSSREILYVYLLAIGSKIFGDSLFDIRIMPLLFFVFNGYLVFRLSAFLFDQKIALLASAIYFLHPFMIPYSVLIKTENFGMFFTILAFICFYQGLQKSKWVYFFGSGALASVAYFFRQAEIAAFFAILLILFIFSFLLRKIKLSGVLAYLGGYLLVVAFIFVFFAQYLPFNEIYGSSINPFFLIVKGLATVIPQLSFLLPEAVVAEPVVKQDLSRSFLEFGRIFDMNLFLILAFGFSCLLFIVKFRNNKELALKRLPLLIWIAVFFFFYGYYYFARGLYPQYFTEMIPPLVIVFSVLLFDVYHQLKEIVPKWVFYLAPVLFYVLYISNRFFTIEYPNRVLYFSLCSLVLSWILFVNLGQKPGKKFLISQLFLVLAFILFLFRGSIAGAVGIPQKLFLPVLFVLIVAGFYQLLSIISQKFFKQLAFLLVFTFLFSSILVAASASGCLIHLVKYDCNWAPKLVTKVADELKSQPKGHVLSGAMVWSYESNYLPFMNITHPLKYNAGFSTEEADKIESHFLQNPPDYVVKDSFLEKNFLQHLDFLPGKIDTEYEIIFRETGLTVYKNRAPTD